MDMFFGLDWHEFAVAIIETLYMISISVSISIIIGMPLGILLYLTSNGMVLQSKFINFICSFIVNIIRSVPFIILLIILMPFTTFLMGTSLGIKGVIPPLIIGAFPFFARLVENSLKDIDIGIIDMAKSCGASVWQIIWHVLLPEILPSIISSITVTTITLVSYTAMAGVVGGGGLGDLAIRYGYQRFQLNTMIITVIMLIIMVQCIQVLGEYISKLFKH